MDLTKREKIGLTTFIIIIIFIVSIMYFNKNKSETIEVISKNKTEQLSNQENSNPDISKSNIKNDIKVYISGEIKKPGVYTLQTGDRVEKLVELAGGFTSAAEISDLNLALKLKDEDSVKIPGKTQDIQVANAPISNGQNSNLISSNRKQSSVIQGGAETSLININTATKEQLKELPRIGDAISQRIIDYREKMGPFKDITNIQDVSGIGTKMFENIKDKITIH